MACPDGCGSILTVNLDPRAGKAWKLYERGRMSLYPSVWRDGGCGAHFIVWKDKIVWCGLNRVEDNSPAYDAALEGRVLSVLSRTAKSDWDVANELDEIPWEVERSLKKLAKAGRATAIGGRPVRFVVPEPARDKTTTSVPGKQHRHKPRRWWQVLWNHYED